MYQVYAVIPCKLELALISFSQIKKKKSKSLLLYGKLYNDFTITCCCKRMESPTVKFTQERVGGHRPRGSDNWVAVPDFHIGLLIEDNCTSRFVRSGPYLYLLIQCEYLQHHHDFQGVSVWMRKHVIPLLMARVETTVGVVSSTLGLGGVASCLDSWLSLVLLCALEGQGLGIWLPPTTAGVLAALETMMSGTFLGICTDELRVEEENELFSPMKSWVMGKGGSATGTQGISLKLGSCGSHVTGLTVNLTDRMCLNGVFMDSPSARYF